jgi:hydrophobic/amphiphilic exporter-1 (mainly G- bacteria), HAE1 family
MLRLFLNNPIRLFALIALVALFGIYQGFQLPISLYPQTSRPVVQMNINYGGQSAKEFIRRFGANIEWQLENIKNSGLKIESVKSSYGHNSVSYNVSYDWNTPFAQALKEVQTVAAGTKGMLPRESADSISVWQWNENGGFLAISFYGKKQSLDELYNQLDPILTPQLKKVADAEEAMLWNPEAKEISVALYPDKLAHYGLLPGDVFRSLDSSLVSFTGGEVKLGTKSVHIQIPSPLISQETIENHLIQLESGTRINLKDIADISIGKSEKSSRSFKTDGKDSLILFANPKSGANVKRMSEEILEIIKKSEKIFPEGVAYKILVDPSEFIRNSISNLIKDVVLAAFLAVLVLFLFIGNFKNVVTAAIEIPLCMVVAFVVMKYTGMNLNLISLGGLALAAGMNVDASVVVMENIFRRQGQWAILNPDQEMQFSQKLELVFASVKEVSLPIILSITTTLIVFIPLAMTTDLTNAILGDLAKAVIYSHAASALVALLIVPTIRLKLMSGAKLNPAPLEPLLKKIETFYLKLLGLAIKFKKAPVIIAPIALAALLAWVIIPRLPKEIVGTPDTDWIFISVTSPQSSSSRMMENNLQEIESRAVKLLGKDYGYTFVQQHSDTRGMVMLRLKDKSLMKSAVKKTQKEFVNTPDTYFFVDAWNPAELPLPNMNHLEVKLSGKNYDDVRNALSRLNFMVAEKGDYERLNKTPFDPKAKIITFSPYTHLSHQLSLSDLLEISTFSSYGKTPGSLNLNGIMTPLRISFADKRYESLENLKAYPIKSLNKLIPLEALGSFSQIDLPSEIYRQNGIELATLTSTLDKDKESNWESLAKTYQEFIEKNKSEITVGQDISVEFVQPKKELFQALDQIKTSLLISLLLVSFILWMQFQSIKSVATILLTVPVGLIGALTALFLMNSTLSLNSALGVILLNGIAVNNAILMVEVYQQLRLKGLSGEAALLETCRTRLRPILITSLTTVLGMMPIALGLGDGGKILQPLGVVVVFGLLLSTILSLIIIPIILYESAPTNLTIRGAEKLKLVPPPVDSNEDSVWQ